MTKISTKKALMLSLLSMLLCVSMLVGSTFAWFTDTASASVNTIQAGTLDVALVDEKGNSLEGKPLKWVAKDSRESIYWEPGCTYKTEEFYIENKGNLNLKFKIVVSGIDGDAKLLNVITFTAMAKANQFHFNSGSASITFGDDNEEEFDLLKGYTYDFNDLGSGFDQIFGADKITYTEYTLEPGDKVGPIAISGHMDENAGNDYQGQTIEGITIYATQGTGEQDSYNGTYDEDAVYPVVSVKTTEDFTKALADTNISTIILSGDMELSNSNVTVNHDVTIDLNGKMLTTTSTDSAAVEVTNGTLTLTGDGKVTGATCVKVTNGGKAVIESGTYAATSGYAVYADGTGVNLTISGGTFESSADYAICVANGATAKLTGSGASSYNGVLAKDGGQVTLGG